MTGKNVGDIRPTQILFSYGVGSIIDLPNISVMVMGLEDWNVNDMKEVSEERLLSAVKNRLGNQVTSLKLPPVPENENAGFFNPFDENSLVGIPVAPFPRWLRCPYCNLLAPINSNLFDFKHEPYLVDKTRYFHASCPNSRKPVAAVPARFLVACEDGHLDDFPWVEYVHKGKTSCKARLRLMEYGVSGTTRDIEIVCDTCNSKRRMAEAFEVENSESLPECRGRHPHLRMFSENGCPGKRKMKPILLGASNSWFPLTLSALHVPSSSNKLQQLVEEHWLILEKITSKEVVVFCRSIGQLKSFAEYTDNEIWEAILSKKQNSDTTDTQDIADLKTPEWTVFTNPDESTKTNDFQLKTVELPCGYEKFFARVVLVERIKEVRALLGFTRLESPEEYNEVLEIPVIKQVNLSRKSPTWVPASLVRGEGIFIQFNEQEISLWLKKKAILEQDRIFFEAYREWRRKRKLSPIEAGFPGIRFILLHSFAHALMRQFALECGYTAASIRERIYAQNPGEDKSTMAGILIYTAAPDSEGTLGGLVSLGKPRKLGRHIEQGLEHIRLCSSDPLCAEHLPFRDDTSLHGAACHACLFAPETSCERGNKYLDRSLIVKTLCTNTCSYFD